MAGQHHEQIRTHHLRTDIRFVYLVPDRKVVFREFPAARTCRQLFCRDAEFEISDAFCGPNDQLQRFRYCSGGRGETVLYAVSGDTPSKVSLRGDRVSTGEPRGADVTVAPGRGRVGWRRGRHCC